MWHASPFCGKRTNQRPVDFQAEIQKKKEKQIFIFNEISPPLHGVPHHDLAAQTPKPFFLLKDTATLHGLHCDCALLGHKSQRAGGNGRLKEHLFFSLRCLPTVTLVSAGALFGNGSFSHPLGHGNVSPALLSGDGGLMAHQSWGGGGIRRHLSR